MREQGEKGWARLLKHLRNRKDLRPLEPVIKDFEARLTALEKAHEPKKRGRPPKKKEGEDEI